MITWLPAREELLNVDGIVADTGWLADDLSAIVPVGTKAAIILTQMWATVQAADMYSNFNLRKDVAQGVSVSDQVNTDMFLGTINSQSAVIEITAARTIEHEVEQTGAGNQTISIRIYVIGYIT